MICKECKYKDVFQKLGNETKTVYCNHPNQGYIYAYFREHDIFKAPGFLGFINSKGVFPVKKTPKWCPLKKEMVGGSDG